MTAQPMSEADWQSRVIAAARLHHWRFFVEAQGLSPDAEITRIEWRYLDTRPCGSQT